MESAFARYLAEHANLATFLELVPGGNNGDELIIRGTRHALERAGVVLIPDPRQAAHILIRGHGSFTDLWGTYTGLSIIRDYSRSYPKSRIAVGPSFFQFTDSDPLDVLRDLQSEVVWFARDQYSFENLKRLQTNLPITPMLSQDAAFKLADSSYVASLRQQCSEEHVLVAIRKDREGRGGLLTRTRGTWLPRALRRRLSAVRDALVARKSSGFIEATAERHPRIANLPRVVRDVSTSVSYAEFESNILRAALIITDRLHVAILGYLLGKEVILREGVNLKIRGVYELSLANSENVALVSE